MLRGRFALIALSLLVAAGPAAAAGGERDVKEHVDLTLVKRTGTTKFQHKGTATGTVRGTVRSRITITHSVVIKGSVTITTSTGRVTMRIDGRARSISMRTRFNGTARIENGTGKWAGAVGKATFSGVVNRGTWHVTLDATGSYHL